MYSAEEKERIQQHLYDQLASKRALSRILAEDEGMPAPSTIVYWQEADPSFSMKLARARELGVEALLDETVEIADNSNGDVYIDTQADGSQIARIDGEAVARSRVRVDTRFKYAQMIAPRKYGPKLDVTSGGEKLEAPVTNNVTLVDARVQSLVRIAQRRLLDAPEAPSIEDLMG